MTIGADTMTRRDGALGALVPEPYRVVGRRTEVGDVVTLSMERCDGREGPEFTHGQFNMLTAFGVGEVAISISSAPGAVGPIEHSVRDVGAVTHALCTAEVGSVIGVRGPFGTGWGIADVEDGADVVVVAGGIGLAPLRGAVRDLVAREAAGRGRVLVVAGARSPDQVLYADDLDSWRRSGSSVDLTVDVGAPGWTGPVGVVTTLLPELPFDPDRAWALTCGPEIMMRFVARGLVDRGVDPRRIRVSLERNMQCGAGLCGHCQLGPLLVCRDGPVVSYGGVADRLFMERGR
ncbi:MAG: FAD/NAD(P)-binding protein [Acidimicrobiales bacterium]|jgi:NAD(P)H-flavin reductase